ncbi:MAG: hypothetical protein ACYCXW_06285 [Solirubrobacteraceae bacterium]
MNQASSGHSLLGRLALIARHPPLWARWLLALLGLAVLILLFWVAARGGGGPSHSESSAEAQANREGRIVTEQDQAPHTAPLRAGASPRAAMERAITADVRSRTRDGQLTGAFQGISCTPAGPAHDGRRGYHCTARLAGIGYPFLGVVDRRTAQLTWCKRDPPPVSGAGLGVPVSPRCLA